MLFRSISLHSFCLLLGFSLRGQVNAQDLSIPTNANWNISSPSSDTRMVREQYANAAAVALVGNIAANGSLSDTTESQALASMYTVLTLQDTLSGNSTWSHTILNNMKTWVRNIDIYSNGTAGSLRTNSNGMQWALALYYAYKAYGDSDLLTIAKDAFDTTYGDYITPSVAAAKQSGPGRNISANSSKCFDQSAGGIFWLPDVHNNTQVQIDAVGPFVVLAGLLFEETGNATYQDLGLQSLQFMEKTLWDSPNGLARGVYDAYLCGANTGQSPEVQGWYIYAVSIFANITAGSDTGTTLTSQLREAVSTAGHNTAWTQSNGVLKDTQDDVYALSDDEFDSKAILVRALSETLRRSPSESDLVQFIEAFLTVQYNTVITMGRNGASYASAPAGPPPTKFSNEGNIMALDMLNAAFAMASQDTTSPSPTSTSDPSPSSSQTSSQDRSSDSSSASHIGAIVGGVVGGILALCAVVGALFWRRRNLRKDNLISNVAPNDQAIEPFFSPALMVTEPYLSIASVPQHDSAYRTSFRGPGHRSKLARELPSPPSTVLPPSIEPPSIAQTSSTSPAIEQHHADLPALVGQLVIDMLRDVRDRDAGSAPPEYGAQ
ncbi:hypothetical protein PENSPDRAFT_681840 [Peniophora sp. CONT]|nr:hypothetical protein PENSPDRAFT_681840 [Peniophora sp. CONT]